MYPDEPQEKFNIEILLVGKNRLTTSPMSLQSIRNLVAKWSDSNVSVLSAEVVTNEKAGSTETRILNKEHITSLNLPNFLMAKLKTGGGF